MTNIMYNQAFLKMFRSLNVDVDIQIPTSVDLSIYAKLEGFKESESRINYKLPFKPTTIRSRTLVIDLSKEEIDIFKAFHPQNKQKIKRAKKEGFYHEVLLFPDSSEVQDFIDFFQAFATWKGIPFLPEDRFRQSAEAGAISITWMREENHKPLCGHAYLHDDSRVIMIHSASHRDGIDSTFRNRIGRANRLLHWKNIVYYRGIGIKWYDFSGIFSNQCNEQELNINEFKRSFGGQEVEEIKVFQAHSLKGMLVLRFMRWKWKMKSNKHLSIK